VNELYVGVQLMLKYLPVVQSDWSSEMTRRRYVISYRYLLVITFTLYCWWFAYYDVIAEIICS